MQLNFIVILTLLLQYTAGSVAKFKVESISSNSLVISMIDIANVSKVNINVQIFDLNRRQIYRETSLYKAQSNQELVVKTRACERCEAEPPGGSVASISSVVNSENDLTITVESLIFREQHVATVIVPELICDHIVTKPFSKKAMPFAQFDFNLATIRRSSRIDSLEKNSCKMFCFYPYIKVNISGNSESFRSQKWCGSLKNLPKRSAKLFEPVVSLIFPIFLLALCWLN